MWNLLKKRDEDCTRLRNLLEESAAARPEAVNVKEFCEVLPAAHATTSSVRELPGSNARPSCDS